MVGETEWAGRFEEFEIDGRNFLHADFSGLELPGEIIEGFERLNALVSRYPENSLNLISDISGLKFDSGINKVAAKYTALNARHVRYDVIIGADGVRRMLAKALMRLSGRRNFHFCFSKEEAVQWLLSHD